MTICGTKHHKALYLLTHTNQILFAVFYKCVCKRYNIYLTHKHTHPISKSSFTTPFYNRYCSRDISKIGVCVLVRNSALCLGGQNREIVILDDNDRAEPYC